MPQLHANLLPVKKMAKANLDVTFSKMEATMKYDGELIGCPMLSDFYELDLFIDTVAVNMCGAVDGNLWHRRLEHLGSNNLQALVKHGMVTGIPGEPGKLDFCDICVLGKHCRDPFTGSRTRATRPLERVHSDVCGPITPAAWDGSRYFVSFIDDYTHFAVVYPLKKFEVFQKFREYEAMTTVADTKCSTSPDVKMNQVEAERLIFDVPEAYKDIFGRTDEALWRRAIEEELKSLTDNRVWRLVKHP